MSFFTNLLGGLYQEVASINMLIAYLLFLYASIGLAKSSRFRWENLRLSKASSNNMDFRKKTMRQASTDYHNWMGSILFVSSFVEVILGFVWIYVVISLTWDSLLSLFAMTVAVVLGHIFSVRSYRKEVSEIFGEQEVYRSFLPLRFLRVDRL